MVGFFFMNSSINRNQHLLRFCGLSFFFLGIQVQFSDDMNHYPGKHQKLLLQLSCFAGFNKEVLPSTSSS